MRQLLYLLPALICPVAMGAMMLFMARGRKAQPDRAGSEPHDAEVARLRAELAAARADHSQR